MTVSVQTRDARRVTINLTPQDLERLEYLTVATGLNKTDCVRRALATQSWVDRMRREGRTILIGDGSEIREVVWHD